MWCLFVPVCSRPPAHPLAGPPPFLLARVLLLLHQHPARCLLLGVPGPQGAAPPGNVTRSLADPSRLSLCYQFDVVHQTLSPSLSLLFKQAAINFTKFCEPLSEGKGEERRQCVRVCVCASVRACVCVLTADEKLKKSGILALLKTERSVKLMPCS